MQQSKVTISNRIALAVSLFDTKKKAAEYLGVHPSTLRRWINKGVTPSKPHQETLKKKARSIRAAIRREAKKEDIAIPRNAPILPFVRKKLRRDGLTDIFYDVSLMSYDGLVSLLLVIAQRPRQALFIRYVTETHQHKIMGPIAISEYDDDPEGVEDLLDKILNNYSGNNKIIEFRITPSF